MRRRARPAAGGYDGAVEDDRLSERASWAWQLGLLALIWGSSFMLIKVGLGSFGPMQVSFGRIAIGALTLLAVLALTPHRLPPFGTVWLHAAFVGLLMNAIPFSLFAWGETRLGSIEAGIWNATTPLMAAVTVFVLLREERPTRRGVVGLLLGFAGVLLVLAPWQGLEGGELAGHLAFAAAAACYGLGTPYMRRHFSNRAEGIVALSTAQLLCATAMTGVVALALEGVPRSRPELLPLLSVVALGALGTGIAYVLFTSVIRTAGATIAASVTYLMPIVSTTLGVVVLAEPLGWNDPAGALVILAGVALASTRAARRRPSAAARTDAA